MDFSARLMGSEFLSSRCEIVSESMRVWQVSFVGYFQILHILIMLIITALHFTLTDDLNRSLLSTCPPKYFT